eukprot:CAMPEP_0197824936 /NCGR_PEP_ID=MMETSP1437-20131217/2119_1 /TAXON_ID=49252 ORGANISM="Eucampia antarctica, Strain CCMP1452" /NCGR_SAMPLE_ID=MMETSP1437 /ASSEMBLY_ACC=CAM_ASM_001096 /LENGTH=463 /DNA_ID=CAMNT_0043424757 /DNA_START=55 /DNA_END=1446 /DNA_ORIENTATION=-
MLLKLFPLPLIVVIVALSNDAAGFNPIKAGIITFKNYNTIFKKDSVRLFSSSVEDQVKTSDGIDLVSYPPPSWEELEQLLPKIDVQPKVTLYRDTNGWCPFCERVWVAMRVKNIPYTETLVSLQNKPQWYKDLVPSTLVPAVLFYGDDDKKDRRIVWESDEILKSLDEDFPDSPQLMLKTPEFEAALKMNEKLQSAGFRYSYGNSTISEDEKMERETTFKECLDELDTALLEENDGPFRLGPEFTGIDAIMIPNLERYRYQLTITKEFDILDGRPNIQKWFDAMDSYGPYSDRVAGDKYSWTATASAFLRFFGGAGDTVAASIQRADTAAEEIAASFIEYEVESEEFALEAAAKLVSNHDAVIADCTRKEPKSQDHIPRAVDETSAADDVLRYASSILVSLPGSAIKNAKKAPLIKISNPVAGALAARTVAKRLSVPRDMGAPAAAILRSVLYTIADRLENEE